ncbi:MAG: CoA transferase [Acidimicrobiales bacterium]|nr:MAG: CoA transferase [Acidimicrobiales bacterium]
MSDENDGPLTGMRVIDIGVLVQGPQAAQTLYEMGADVIKVELPGIGDHGRWIPASETDPRPPFFIGSNRGKRSITVNLRDPAGLQVFLDLVTQSDVVISNFTAGAMDRAGIGYEDLAAVNPRIVYAAGTAYGLEGDAARRKGADLGAQAAGGLMRATESGETRPGAVGITIADHIASQNMVNGVLAALLARERTGRGQKIETSLVGGQIYAQASEYTAVFLTGEDLDPPTHGGHPVIEGLYGVVPTADGAMALVGIAPQVRAEFFAIIERPALADEDRFMTTQIRGETRDDLFAAIGEAMRSRTTAEWGAAFTNPDIRWSPVQRRLAAAADPDLHASGYFYTEDHPEWGEITMVGHPIRFSDTPARPGGLAPELGQHTEEILLEIGRSWDDITALRDQGAI